MISLRRTVYNATSGHPESGVEVVFIYQDVIVDTDSTTGSGKYQLVFGPEISFYPDDPGFNLVFKKENYSGPLLSGIINISQGGKYMMPVEIQTMPNNSIVIVGETGLQAILDYDFDQDGVIDKLDIFYWMIDNIINFITCE